MDRIIDFLAAQEAATTMSVEGWFDKYGVAILMRERLVVLNKRPIPWQLDYLKRQQRKATKKELEDLQKEYPLTVTAMGGPVGVQHWLAEDKPLPQEVSLAFLEENELMKGAIANFRKCYPKTLSMMGGSKGFKKWLVDPSDISTQVACVFRAEHNQIVDNFETFEKFNAYAEKMHLNLKAKAATA